MKALITGATGFVGKLLVERLIADGVELRIWARSPERAKAIFPNAEIAHADRSPDGLDRAVAGVDTIINLAGEPVVGPRWSDERKRVLEDSRVGLTKDLAAAIGRATTATKTLISASAVGYYGDRGDDPLDEASAPGSDFLAKLCVGWEEAAMGAEAFGVRVARIRIGIVLGKNGGALAQMLTPFKLGLGGRLGSGRQWMPWIHLADLVELLVTAARDDRYRGAFNGVSPNPVTNQSFTKVLAGVLHRPAFAAVPKLALSLLMGQAAEIALGGQNVRPARALELGFTFGFADLQAALMDIVPAR